MTARGRRVAGSLAALALLLAAGRWIAEYRAERLWEASVSSAVATAGARRALATTGLELLGVALATGWLLLHFSLAARVSFPAGSARGREVRLGWPRALPRWSVAAVAVVAGVIVGSGLGHSLEHLRLALTGVQFGIRDPLAARDLGTYLGSFPFWLTVQRKAALLSVVALGGTVLLLFGSGAVRLIGHRIRVGPEARGQLAVLLAGLAAVLAWDLLLEPLRLAAGLRGPLLPAEFALRSLLAYLVAGLGGLAGLLSLLWWARIRGGVPLVIWMMFALARAGIALLPIHPQLAQQDPAWRARARALDAVAFGLAGLERPPPQAAPPVSALVPTLWDDSVMARVMGTSSLPHRAWLAVPPAERRAAEPRSHPVWIGLRETDDTAAAVLAVSDDQTAAAGAPLFFPGPGGEPVPSPRELRLSIPGFVVHPEAPRIALHPEARQTSGIRLTRWLDRVAIAWAWQAPIALSASRGARLDWRLDPATRLAAAAPFARWTTPRLRILGERWVWQSDGVLISRYVPSSGRVRWSDAANVTTVSLARSVFMGTIEAETGAVRIFRRTEADSLAAAWARITAPLIEPADRIPPALRDGEAYPLELALVQARVLAGPAWDAGRLEAGASPDAMPSEAAGGSAHVVPLVGRSGRNLASLLWLHRTPAGDSLTLWRFDPLAASQVPSSQVPSPPSLRQQWERFPFRMLLADSILAVGARFQVGAVRYALTADGVLAYQPGWAEPPGRRPRLALVNLALGNRLGTGRDFLEAWRNLRGEASPTPMAPGAEALLAEVWRWWWYADSALQRGDLAELGRALENLRELLERRR